MDLLGGIFITFILIAIAVGSMLNEIQLANERKAVFRGVIPADRAKFFQDAFGLSSDEMKLFHFDGCLFSVGNGVPYWDVNAVSCIAARDVRVVNPELPHTSSWRYERVNGGPDRRYKNNALTRTSRRYELLFTGDKKYRLAVYSQPYSYETNKVNDTVRKINELLAISKVIDSEASFNEYSGAFYAAQRTGQSLDEAKSKKAKANTALSASRRLIAQNPAVSSALVPKQNEMLAEISQFDSEIMRFQQEIILAQEKMKAVAQSIRTQIALMKDVQVVQSYVASQPVGMNAANEAGSSANIARKRISS